MVNPIRYEEGNYDRVSDYAEEQDERRMRATRRIGEKSRRREYVQENHDDPCGSGKPPLYDGVRHLGSQRRVSAAVGMSLRAGGSRGTDGEKEFGKTTETEQGAKARTR